MTLIKKLCLLVGAFAFWYAIFFPLSAEGGDISVKKPKLDAQPHEKVEVASFAMG